MVRNDREEGRLESWSGTPLDEQNRGATIRVLSTWGKQLEAVGLWYDQLLANIKAGDVKTFNEAL